MAFTYLTVTIGSGVRDPGGTQMPAKVRFTPTATMRNGTTTVGKVECTVGAGGTLTPTVAATDDPGTLPTGVAYLIEVIPRGGAPWSFHATLPAASPGGAVDLYSLADLGAAPVLAGTAETTTGSAAKVTAHTAASDPHADRAFTTAAIATHSAVTTSVHGIANTAALATTAAVAAGFQPLDADLTAVAALSPTNDDVVQRKSGAWTNRTMAQVATDLHTPLDVRYSSAQVRVSDLARPFIIPHRGAGELLAPENTMEAFRIGASYGQGIVDGGDWYTTSDGALVCIHDATVDRTTTLTGNTTDLTASRAALATVDCSSWFGGGFPDTKPTTAETLYGELGGTVVLSPEPKSLPAATALAALVQRMGLQKSVFPTAFSSTYLTPFVAIGCTDVLVNVLSMPSGGQLAAYLAAGIRWIGITTSFTAGDVATLVALGFEVMIGTTARAGDATPYAGASVSAWASNDPLYFAHGLSAGNATRYLRTTDPFANATYYHGHISSQVVDTSPTRRGQFLGTNRWGFGTAGTANLWVLQGWACPLANPTGTYSITYTMTVDAVGSDTSRWGGAFVGMTNDGAYGDTGASTETGYQVWLRASGQLNLVRKSAGVSGTTQSVSTSSISAGGTATVRIDVTPTTVTATRTDGTPASVSVTDNTVRGGYWHLGRNDLAGTTGFQVSFSAITIA